METVIIPEKLVQLAYALRFGGGMSSFLCA